MTRIFSIEPHTTQIQVKNPAKCVFTVIVAVFLTQTLAEIALGGHTVNHVLQVVALVFDAGIHIGLIIKVVRLAERVGFVISEISFPLMDEDHDR